MFGNIATRTVKPPNIRGAKTQNFIVSACSCHAQSIEAICNKKRTVAKLDDYLWQKRIIWWFESEECILSLINMILAVAQQVTISSKQSDYSTKFKISYTIFLFPFLDVWRWLRTSGSWHLLAFIAINDIFCHASPFRRIAKLVN